MTALRAERPRGREVSAQRESFLFDQSAGRGGCFSTSGQRHRLKAISVVDRRRGVDEVENLDPNDSIDFHSISRIRRGKIEGKVGEVCAIQGCLSPRRSDLSPISAP